MQHEHLRLVGETLSVTAIIGTIAGLLPPLAALCAIIWYCVLFYDRFKKKNEPTDKKD